MGTNKGSRKLSSPEGAVRFRHQSTGAGADAVASSLLSFHFHRHRPLAKKERIKSNGKKATTCGWITEGKLLFTLVCGGFFSLFHVFIGRRDVNHPPNYHWGIHQHVEPSESRIISSTNMITKATTTAYKPRVNGITPLQYEPPNTDSVRPVLLSNSKLLTCIQ